ncbi:MAG: hypothetical protein HYR96_07680 [Deltaproteobacteria bacterium]|nr:hypothetical protein [Deltaproteobacteria bacterium]MBI3293170.1 hypothetical protein [Deltaproteobacteria bacterium]
MRIRNVQCNNYRKCFEIDTAKGSFSFPFSRAEVSPTVKDRVKEVLIDRELGSEWISYSLESGKKGSIPLDAFLDYNRDPEYLTKMLLHSLTVDALERLKNASITRRELSRKLRTSPAQLYRLLDTANQSKTIDQMIKLLAVLGYEIEYRVIREKKRAA